MGSQTIGRMFACALAAALGVCAMMPDAKADPTQEQAVTSATAREHDASAGQKGDAVRVAGQPAETDNDSLPALRQFTVEDAGRFGWYQGRKIPIVTGRKLSGGAAPATLSAPTGVSMGEAEAMPVKTVGGWKAGLRQGGDTCDVATVIPSLPFSATGDTCAFANDYNESCPGQTAVGAPDVVYEITPTVSTTVDITLCRDSMYDTKIYVYEGFCRPPDSGEWIGCGEDDCTTAAGTQWVSEILDLSLQAGITYYIIVDGWDSGATGCGFYTLDITNVTEVDCPTGVGCQLPDLQGYGRQATVGAESDQNPVSNSKVAETFKPFISGSVSSLCWWGFYFDTVAEADCGPGSGDDFTVTYYLDDAGDGVPGTVLAGPFSGASLTITNTFATGNLISAAGGALVAQYQYEATHDAVLVSGGQCYWVEIVNNTTGTCVWHWETAAPGDGRAAQDPDGSGYVPTPYNNPPFADYDLALCMNIPLAPTGCGPLPQDPALYEAIWSFQSNTVDWFQAYNFERPFGDLPHGITYIEAESGTTGCDSTIVGDTFYHLFEAYDEYLPGDPVVHGTYLGGVLVDLGVIPPGRDVNKWTVVAPQGTYFIPTGGDGQAVFAHHVGLLDGSGEFQTEPFRDQGGADYTDPPCSVASPGERMAVGLATEELIDMADPQPDPENPELHGQREPGSLYSDGFGGSSSIDRVFESGDGPLSYGGTDPGVLYFQLRGVGLLDCNVNGFNDDWEIGCFESAYVGEGGCAPTACPIYDALGSGGFIQEPAFTNPLATPTCVPLAVDINTNGFIDECETGDCNENGIPDICDLDCDAINLSTGILCSVEFDGVGTNGLCGQSDDCNSNGRPDDCELEDNDCNTNSIPDECDIASGSSADCNGDIVPDECGVDCDENGVLDLCERPFFDCNQNGQEDFCDILLGFSNDFDDNGTPDDCLDTCTDVWGGFEGAEFPVGSIDGIDSDVDGSDWSVGAGGDSQVVTPDGCPDGVSTKALKVLAGDASGEASPFGPSTISEFFITEGGVTPPPIAQMSVLFDFKVEGSRDSNVDIRLFLNENDADPGADTGMILWFGSTQTTVSGAAAGNLSVLGGDGFEDTGVVLQVDKCYSAEARFDSGLETGELLISTNGAPFVSVFSGSTTDSDVGRIDYLIANSFDNTDDETGTGEPASWLVLDNFEVCEIGAAVSCTRYKFPDGTPSSDCDGDNICDIFQLDGGLDLDGNGILDRCEGHCNDCNNNFIPDAYEITEGSAPDADTNGVIDWCERSTHDNGFEPNEYGAGDGFVVGPIDRAGQQGWTEIRGGAEISDTVAGGFPTTGTQYLVVKEDPNRAGLTTFLYGPRLDKAGDADIELWSWNMGISSTEFGSMFIEILDICEDDTSPVTGDGTFIFLGPYIDSANTGFEFRSNDPLPGDVSILMLEDPGVRTYGATGAGDVSGDVIGSDYSAGIRIKNNRGETEGYWAADQASLLDNLISLGTTETQGLEPHLGTSVPKGGDRQLAIRTDGDFGLAGTTEFRFDDFSYQTWPDCDNDGLPDGEFLAGFPEYDVNNDGIPDNCQDCNDDCGVFPISAGSRGCLDPCEVDADSCGGVGGSGSDCNANGIPDDCDADPTLPFDTMLDVGCCFADPNCLPGGRCFETLFGGGSCDLNTNSIPDECEGADCDGDGCLDLAQIALDPSLDINENDILDSCEDDCNNNNVPDAFDISTGRSQDAFPNPPFGDGVPDECCLSSPIGDMDDDGDIDAVDYQAMQRCGGQTPSGGEQGEVAGSATGGIGWDGLTCGCADLNNDGVVDDCDVQLLLYHVTGPQ